MLQQEAQQKCSVWFGSEVQRESEVKEKLRSTAMSTCQPGLAAAAERPLPPVTKGRCCAFRWYSKNQLIGEHYQGVQTWGKNT